MSEMKKTKVHLISGFLGTGKTTALKSLMEQKDPNEKWVIIVNEFGEIGIDGAVLSDNGIPVAEIAGGCLCCTAGPQMGVTVQKMLRDAKPDRLMIEASGLAHAASVIDELKAKPLDSLLEIGAVLPSSIRANSSTPITRNRHCIKTKSAFATYWPPAKPIYAPPNSWSNFTTKRQNCSRPKPKWSKSETRNSISNGSIFPSSKNHATASKPCRTTRWASSRKVSHSPPDAISTAKN